MSLYFKKERKEGEILANWWEGLKQDAGGRARLRRCKSPEEVMLEPAFHRLLNRMRPFLTSDEPFAPETSYMRLAAVAGLLSHVTANDGRALAERMAEPRGNRPLLSALRFRRLLKSQFDDLYPALIRVIRQLDKQASLFDLATSVFYWGDTIRKRWALAYFPKVTE
ncbi:MAG: type I-E CRISPR-associated protein Cse2/CasB [Candidatus Thiodiazotropha sp. (ex Rostrolucina anterorostrata)]|nr:type I-E CRISPR-associated protein Cse2/CasB [Candidatus Thiodiazotropha sp. (ex Rostrolucina anterorostrata)]